MKYFQINESRSQEINSDPDYLISLIQKHCSKSFETLINKKRGYFRGIRYGSSNALVFDGSKSTPRKSKNTSNYYTNLLSQLPSWKDWPDRSKSIICSTSRFISGGYGNRYLVFPYDSATIGFCNDEDLWYSFGYLFYNLQKADFDVTSMSRFNDYLMVILDRFSDSDLETSSLLEQDLLEVTEKILQSDIPLTKIKNYIKMNGNRNLFDIFNDHLDPEKNDFFKLPAGNVPSRSLECWTEGPAILIYSEHEDFFNKVFGHPLAFYDLHKER